MVMYHQGNRALQDAFGTRRLADRMEERIRRPAFTEDDAAFIASLRFFFVATATAEGHPDCSFKGGEAGFARVIAPDLLVFPDYDGNGMFKSLGNIRANPRVGLLFIGMEDKPRRLRVNGTAQVVLDDPLLAGFEGAPGAGARHAGGHLPQLPAQHPADAGGGGKPLCPALRHRAGGTGLEGASRSSRMSCRQGTPDTACHQGTRDAACRYAMRGTAGHVTRP